MDSILISFQFSEQFSRSFSAIGMKIRWRPWQWVSLVHPDIPSYFCRLMKKTNDRGGGGGGGGGTSNWSY